MKEFNSIIILLFFAIQSSAQTPQVPSVIPGNPQLPVNKKPLILADLSVSCSRITARTVPFGGSGFTKKSYYTDITRVTIAVTNSGDITSQPVTIKGFVAPNPLNLSSIAAPSARFSGDKASIKGWVACPTFAVEVNAIAPGATFSREYENEFYIDPGFTGSGTTFFFCVLVDYNQSTTEKNENNNISVPVAVTNPNVPTMPDLTIMSYRVVSVTEDVSRHLFETTLSVTVKNQGTAIGSDFYLDLQSAYGTTGGGTDYSMIGVPALIGPMFSGETRTVRCVFTKDITAMGRARLQCVMRVDATSIIEEVDEENNRSTFFYITPPRRL